MIKASLAMLEKSTMSVEYELLHMQEKAKLQENLVEHHKYEVTYHVWNLQVYFLKFVSHFEEMIKVLFAISPFCCNGDCNIFIILTIADYGRVVSTQLQVHIVCTELCDAHLKLIEESQNMSLKSCLFKTRLLWPDLLAKKWVSDLVN